MKTLCDGGCIHEIAGTQTANNVLIQVFNLHSDLLLPTHPRSLVTHPRTPCQLAILYFQILRSSPASFAMSGGLAPRSWHTSSAQQRAPRTAGAPFTWTRLTLLSQGILHDVGGTMRRRPSPDFGNPIAIAQARRTPRLCAGALGSWPATARPSARPSSHR